MTISSSTDRATFPGNGVTQIFDLPFRFFDNSDIQALLIDDATGALTLLTLGTHYTLSGAGDPEVDGSATGKLNMVTAPAFGQSLFIKRVVPLTQPTDIVNQGSFYPEVHETVFDRLVMQIQQAQGGINNSLQLHPSGLFWDALSKRIANVSSPVNPQDAATLLWVQQYTASILQTGQGPLSNAYNVAYPGFNAGITTVGDFLDSRVPFTVSDVAELRTAAGRFDGDRVLLLGYNSGVPGVGGGLFRRVTSASPADNGVTVFGAPGNIRWIREQSPDPVDVRWAGAVPADTYSGGMFDSKDAVARAQAVAGVNGRVHFPLPPGMTEAHYLLNATGLNLAGSYISADPGVVIHAPFTSDNEGEKPRTIGDVVFSEEAPVGSNNYQTARGENRHALNSAAAAGMAAASITVGDRQRKFSFVSDARAVRISDVDTGAFTLDAAGMTISDNQVLWANPASAGADLQGIEFAAAAGAEVECLLHNVTNGGGSGSAYIGVRCVGVNGATAATRYYKFTIAAGAYQIYSGSTLLQTIVFNNEADRLNDVQGPVRLGIRVGQNSRFIQLILNGKNYGELDLGTSMAHSMFWLADQAGRATLQFKYPIARNRDTLVATKPLRIACLGDSITRGARSTNEWPQLLRDFAPHMPGIGEIVQLTNMAVSGITAATVAANIGSYDFTGYDYVLVMLGTNDCQGGGNGGLGAFFSDIVTIAQAIAAAGPRPIFGVFPTYTSSGETGNGNATTNIAYIPNYQQVIRERIMNAGYTVADVDEFFGNNYGFPGSFDTGLSTSWYNDNIHPNTKGQIAVAAAFAAALSRLAVRPVRGCYVSMIKPQGTFAINNEASFGILRAVLQGNVVSVHGAVSGGGTGQVIGALPVWARPAAYMRHAVFARTAGAQVLANLEIRNDGNLVSGIAWGTEQADLSVNYHV